MFVGRVPHIHVFHIPVIPYIRVSGNDLYEDEKKTNIEGKQETENIVGPSYCCDDRVKQKMN
jgi:hypothetical protein